jgi:Tfp pilus assembly protein FimV
MQSARSLIIGASLGTLIGLGSTPNAEAKQSADDQSAKEMAQELKALRQQVDSLQHRLDAQASEAQQTKAQADSAAAQAASAKADAAAIPAQLQAQVQTAVDAAKPKTDKIHYKGVTVTLGGFLAAESVYRSRNTESDIGSSYSAIPYNNNSLGQTSELRFTARQSRFSALVQGDVSPDTHLGF